MVTVYYTERPVSRTQFRTRGDDNCAVAKFSPSPDFDTNFQRGFPLFLEIPDTVPACNGQRQTNRHRAITYLHTALCLRRIFIVR